MGEIDSKEPNCVEYINENGEPVFIEHVFNCSRFWVCEPSLRPCLFECAPMPGGGALYFDVRYQYPVGPVCDWPSAINCTNKPAECGQCEVWQECVTGENGATICTPNCKIDPHCQENEYCDFSEGGEGNCVEGCRNGAACGNNVQPCGTCENHICVGEPECCTNADCQAGQTCENNVCKYECNVDSDCTDPEKPLCSDDHLCVAGCRGDDDCDGYNNVCNLPGYENCNYCSGGGANEIGSCNPGCIDNNNCPGEQLCNANHLCECTVDEDCADNEFCDAGQCLPGCNEDSDCTVMSCSTCSLSSHTCVNPECCSDSDCNDPEKPTCSDDNLCIAGCRADSDCDGYNNVCDSIYSNCNYCNVTGENTIGSCSPGCADDNNCPSSLPECVGTHQCGFGGTPQLEWIRFVTASCTGCQGSQVEDGPIMNIMGGESVDGFTSCQTNQLDHPDRVDFADGVSTDFTSDVADKDVMGTCYKANLQVEVTGGDITWTSTVGEWTLDGGQVDFGWSGAGSCKFSCCLNKPSLDASTPTASLVNCKKNCGDNLVC